MSRDSLTIRRELVLARGPHAVVVANTDTLSDGDVIVAPQGDATLVLEHGNRFDLSAPRVLAGFSDVQDRALGDSVITLRDGLDVTLHLGIDNATVIGADDASVIVGGPAGGYATVALGSARESVIAGPSGATISMTTAQAGARIAGGGVTTVGITGRYGDAARLGTELRGVAELDVRGADLTLDLRDAGIGAVALFGSQMDILVGDATRSVTDYAGGNILHFSAVGQVLRLPYAGTADLAPDRLVGMVAGNAIDVDLPYSANEVLTYDAHTGRLTLFETRSGETATVLLEPGQAEFALSADGGMESGDTGTLITLLGDVEAGGGGDAGADPGEAPCFAAGTRLRTVGGWTAVERLRVGDHVLTADGRAAPVRWIGDRGIDCRSHPAPERVLPIRIEAGAFATGLPASRLRLSPDHAVFLSGVLIPIKHLVNGATICREDTARVHYFHVELDRHDIVLAEGLAVESYLDTGNRHQFTNAGGVVALHADFAGLGWDGDACAPLLLEGPLLCAARARLNARAAALGWGETTDPDLHLMVDGQRIWGQCQGEVWSGWAPPGMRTVAILSRSGAPADCDLGSADRRCLGVALYQVVVRGTDGAGIADAAGGQGWLDGMHPPERDDRSCWRWTDGQGRLDPALWRGLTGPFRIELHLAGGIRYRTAEEAPAQPWVSRDPALG